MRNILWIAVIYFLPLIKYRYDLATFRSQMTNLKSGINKEDFQISESWAFTTG
jgi:hypothetical protein